MGTFASRKITSACEIISTPLAWSSKDWGKCWGAGGYEQEERAGPPAGRSAGAGTGLHLPPARPPARPGQPPVLPDITRPPGGPPCPTGLPSRPPSCWPLSPRPLYSKDITLHPENTGLSVPTLGRGGGRGRRAVKAATAALAAGISVKPTASEWCPRRARRQGIHE